MRAILLATLALPLAAASAPAATSGPLPTQVQASYTAYWSGFSVATLDASLELAPESYRVIGTMRTTGLLAVFMTGETSSYAEGRVRPAATPLGLMPERFGMEGRWRDRLRAVAMAWRGADPEIIRLEPANQDERDPVPPEMQRGTVDGLTALAALVRQAAASSRCDGSAEVFDGRRRSDFTAVTEGMETLPAHRWGGFAGPALRCRFEGRQVAGFWKEQDPAEAGKPRGGTAWFASPGPGLPMIPVRIEAESNWGTVYVHMTRAAPGLHALPTRQTAR